MRNWYTAQELAGLLGMPGTARSVKARAQRERWAGQRRLGSKAIEYAFAVLPSETQAALIAASVASEAPTAVSEQSESTQRDAKNASRLSEKQRSVMTARLAFVREIERMSQTISQQRAILALVELAKNDQLSPYLTELLVRANDRKTEDRSLSERTLKRWLGDYRKQGETGLAPARGGKDMGVPDWAKDFLRCFQRPTKPSVEASYAEFVAAPAANAHIIAEEVHYEQAAAVPTTFLPIWNMLHRKVQLKPWETVLVLSASAGVGTAAIQVASKAIGARVIATTSTAEKVAKARELGADEVIDYNEEDITERARALTGGVGVDAVVDHVGADFFPKAFSALRPGGRYGICGATTGLRTELHMGLLFSRQVEIFGVFMGTKTDMGEIVSMLNQGTIHPVVHQVFPLAEAAAAHQSMEEQNFFGKLVLTP